MAFIELDKVKTLVDKRDFDGKNIPKGTSGIVIGVLSNDAEHGSEYGVNFGNIYNIVYREDELELCRSI